MRSLISATTPGLRCFFGRDGDRPDVLWRCRTCNALSFATRWHSRNRCGSQGSNASDLFHWGLHAWAIYAIVALILAFFSYRHGLPLTLRSALYPIIGDRIYGPVGHAVDIFAVIGTVFGVATSLGYGVLQVNAGLNHLFGVPINETVQVILIVVITGLATISVVSGLDKGIRILSELNLGLALLLWRWSCVWDQPCFC